MYHNNIRITILLPLIQKSKILLTEIQAISSFHTQPVEPTQYPMENHLQIFSLKSNLITNANKGYSANFNLGSGKNNQHHHNLNNHHNQHNQHGRMKSICFSNMLQTIRNNFNRDRAEERQSVDVEKQNTGMVIQAKTFKVVYGHETPLIAQPPRIMPQSRSFLIRSHHQKKTVTSTSLIKPIQSKICSNIKTHPPSSTLPTLQFTLGTMNYNFQSGESLQTAMAILYPYQNQHPQNNQHAHIHGDKVELTIFFSGGLIRTQSISQHFCELVERIGNLQYISVFIVTYSKQKAYQYHDNQTIKRNCHILYPQCGNSNHYSNLLPNTNQPSNHKTNNNKNNSKEVFFDLNSLAVPKHKMSKRILVIQSTNSYQYNYNVSHGSNKQNYLYFPFLNNQNQQPLSIREGIQQQLELNQMKIAFLKISNINMVKSIQLEHFPSIMGKNDNFHSMSHQMSLQLYSQEQNLTQKQNEHVSRPQLSDRKTNDNKNQQSPSQFQIIREQQIKSRSRCHYRIKIQMYYHPNIRKPSLSTQIYPLKSIVKLQLQNKYRQKNKPKSMQAVVKPSTVSNQSTNCPVQLQCLQQKLVQYTKILKSQQPAPCSLSSGNINPTASTSTASTSTTGNTGPNKPCRRSLTTKSPYQLVSQLIRNNVNIHKQINAYVQSCQAVNLCTVEPICHDVTYYIIQ